MAASQTQRAHLACIAIGLAIVAFVTAVLADGKSVVVLKQKDLPVVTNPAIVNATLEGLLGAGYGIGLDHDASGRGWNTIDPNVGSLKQLLTTLGAAATLSALPGAIAANALKHPAKFLDCHGLLGAGNAAMALGYIADVAAALMLLAHAGALAGVLPGKQVRTLALSVWSVLSLGFFVVMVLAVAIYTTAWECDQPVIPTLKLSDSFDLSYGLPFAVVGIVASVLALVITATRVPAVEDGHSQSAPQAKSPAPTRAPTAKVPRLPESADLQTPSAASLVLSA